MESTKKAHQDKLQMQKELKACSTMNEMWAVLNKYYDLDTQLNKYLAQPLAVTQLTSKIDFITKTLQIKKRT